MKLPALPFANAVFQTGKATRLMLRRLFDGIVLAAFGLLGSSLVLTALAAAYTLKRALNIDVVPGVDVLPDEEIEALINGALTMLGF
ncbi:hypothetical protein EAH89_14425 [Roseomonas nepalensis]|uniref:Uncharacterized protein n=1 Tax=Muricoccus nepalensis TaxID=1854500 RepID=A0A502G2H2_9PROT|nr:hypothetical protein [Roseomonas nepalensis]TPG55750.1 hypothetical protein EAH89_14425 [Roseomonas nepalensis]